MTSVKSGGKSKNSKLTESKEITDFKNELFIVSERLKRYEQQFNMTENEDLLDALIYEHKALESRYAYLMKKARDMEIEINFFERF